MKNEARFLRGLWLALSEVPGWPDAPASMRLRRLWPIIVPLLGVGVLTFWMHQLREPHRNSVRAAHSGVLELEHQVEALRLTCSDQAAEEVMLRARAARVALLPDAGDVAPLMEDLRDQIATLGWKATFQAYDVGGEADDESAGPLSFAPVRMRLVPRPENLEPFPGLIEALRRLSSTARPIDVTKVAIRADEPGQPQVDVNLRVAIRASDEKAAQ